MSVRPRAFNLSFGREIYSIDRNARRACERDDMVPCRLLTDRIHKEHKKNSFAPEVGRGTAGGALGPMLPLRMKL